MAGLADGTLYLYPRALLQPPRRTPGWKRSNATESAYPYHDWNERITAECYAPNGASRILDDGGYIRQS